MLLEYDWPGNVRELENLIERLVVLSNTSTLGLEFCAGEDVTCASGNHPRRRSTLEGAVEAVKRRMIISALRLKEITKSQRRSGWGSADLSAPAD